MNINLIVAVTENDVIGRGHLSRPPWNLPDDLKHFLQHTNSHAVLMGRNTHQTLGKALPNRLNLVISRRNDLILPGCLVVNSLEWAIDLAADAGHQQLFVIGGQQVYNLAFPLATHLYLTRLHTWLAGDIFFDWHPDNTTWKLQSHHYHPVDPRHPYAFTFTLYERQ